MKKLLLLLFAFLCSMGMWADVVTFTFKTDNDITYTATGTSGGGAACTVSKSNVILNGSNAYTESTKTLICYGGSTLTITAPGNITQIDLSYNGKVYPFDEAVGDGTKGAKFSASGAHPASYSPASPASSVTLNNPNGGKTELLTLSVTYTAGAIVNVNSISLDRPSATLIVGEKLTLNPTILPANATNKLINWSSSDETVVKVVNGVVSAKKAGNATVTASTVDGNHTASCTFTVDPKVAPMGSVFYESFDAFDGQGANDDKWGGSLTQQNWSTSQCDNSGWVTEGTMMEAYQCACMRKDVVSSGLTTPVIGAAGNGYVQFNAESWTNDGSTFYVDIIGGGNFVANEDLIEGNITNGGKTAKVTMPKNDTWKTFSLRFYNLTPASKFRFYAPVDKRAFLDEVAVLIDEYPFTAEDSDFYSLYLSYPVQIPNELKVYTGELNADETSLILTEITDYIPAETAVLVKTDYIYRPYSFCNIYTSSAFTGTNDLLGVNAQTNSSELVEPGKQVLTLGVADGVVGFHQPKNTYVGANKAYLLVSADSGAKTISISYDEATGIQSVQQNAQNGVAYNLAGQRVAAKAKGIVIMNGKKYLNK